MFDIGFAELLVLTVIAMVVIGPERLPSVMRSVGKTVGQARRFLTNIQNQIEQEVKLDELNKKIMAQEELKKTMSPHELEDAEVPSSAPTAQAQDPAANNLATTDETKTNETSKPE